MIMRQKRHNTSKHVSQALRRLPPRAGFTFIELMISATMVTLILGAVVAISQAVIQGWGATDRVQSLQVATYQTSVQIYKMLRSANYVGVATADDQQAPSAGTVSAAPGNGAALMFWTENAAGTDAKIEACEVSVIAHDRSDNTLKLYQLPATATNAGTRFYTSDISTSTALNAFMAMPGVTCQTIATGVSKAAFAATYTNDRSTRQSVDFQLTFDRGGQTRDEFGTAALRSPIKPDDT